MILKDATNVINLMVVVLKINYKLKVYDLPQSVPGKAKSRQCNWEILSRIPWFRDVRRQNTNMTKHKCNKIQIFASETVQRRYNRKPQGREADLHTKCTIICILSHLCFVIFVFCRIVYCHFCVLSFCVLSYL